MKINSFLNPRFGFFLKKQKKNSEVLNPTYASYLIYTSKYRIAVSSKP